MKMLFLLLALAGGALAFTDPHSGVTFPEKLGGLTFESRKTFEQPGFGYSVRYVGPGDTIADVFVYDNRQEKIPDGILSPLIQEQIGRMSESIAALAERGNYSDVKLLAKGVASDTGNVPFAWTRHQYVKSGRTVISQTLLTAFHDHFIKVRLTYPSDSKAADGFAAGLAALLDASRGNPYRKPPPAPPPVLPASEVKSRVIALCEQLESEPFADGAKELRGALFKYFQDAPDITITIDTDVLGKPDDSDPEHAAVVLAAYMFAMGRWIIENPDRAKDAVAVLEGALRTYESMKRQRPGFRMTLVEKLVELKRQGKLPAHVKDALAKRR